MNGRTRIRERWPAVWERAICGVMLFPVFLLSRLPQPLLSATIGRCCYFFIYSFARYRYQVVVQNLSRSFPEKPYGEIYLLAKDFYRYFSGFVVEMIKSLSISRRELAGRIHIVNVDVLHRYQNEARPMVALLGHYGNWESLNILPSKLQMPVNALYKPLSNPSLGRIVMRIRTRFGMQLIPAGRAVRQLMGAKRGASLNLFIADQFPGRAKGHRMELLHQPTTLFDGAEKLAKAIDAVVLYVELEKNSDNGWNVHFSVITDRPNEMAEGQITESFGRRLQQTIRKQPAYWLWSHKRWK